MNIYSCLLSRNMLIKFKKKHICNLSCIIKLSVHCLNDIFLFILFIVVICDINSNTSSISVSYFGQFWCIIISSGQMHLIYCPSTNLLRPVKIAFRGLLIALLGKPQRRFCAIKYIRTVKRSTVFVVRSIVQRRFEGLALCIVLSHGFQQLHKCMQFAQRQAYLHSG